MTRTRPAPRLHPHPTLVVVVVAWFLLAKADDVLLGRSLRLALLVVVVADLAWAIARTRRAAVRVVDQPVTAFVGDDTPITVEVTGAGRGIAVALTSAPGAPWFLAVGDSVGPLSGTAPFRGVVRVASVQLRGHGPLGLIGYSQTHALALRPIWIAPRPIAPRDEVRLAAAPGDDAGPPELGDAVPAGVREYRPGDPWRRIAWPVTARAGRLVTREYERDAAPVLRLAVDLGPTPGPQGEQAVAVAAGIGLEALRRGDRLEVFGRWPAELDLGPAVDAVGLHRVMAVVEYGPVTIPDGRGVLVVGPGGVEWR